MMHCRTVIGFHVDINKMKDSWPLLFYSQRHKKEQSFFVVPIMLLFSIAGVWLNLSGRDDWTTVQHEINPRSGRVHAVTFTLSALSDWPFALLYSSSSSVSYALKADIHANSELTHAKNIQTILLALVIVDVDLYIIIGTFQNTFRLRLPIVPNLL